MPKAKTKSLSTSARIRIAHRVCLQKLDIAGFCDPDPDDIDGPEIDENGNVYLTVRVMITGLDIEQDREKRS